jgi:hypothetical protein
MVHQIGHAPSLFAKLRVAELGDGRTIERAARA